jgi:hypothetical protein
MPRGVCTSRQGRTLGWARSGYQRGAKFQYRSGPNDNIKGGPDLVDKHNTEPREDDNGRLVGFKSQFDPFSVVSAVVEREAVILLAGPVAKAIKAGRSDPKHGGSDFSLALFMAQHEREGESSFELVAHLNYLLADTIRLLSNPVVWRAVELVGMALSTRKSLSSEEVGKAVEQAKTEVKDIESFRADRLIFERTEPLMRKFLRRGIDAVINEASQL